MTQTYFDCPLEERYTWYSENKTTKKVIDYILVEPYVQQHVKNCSVQYNLDFESDHRLLMVELCTPSTKKARKSLKKHSSTQKPDPKSLAIQEVKQLFLQKVLSEILHKKLSGVMIEEESIVSILKDAAETTLPKLKRTNQPKEIWKEDNLLNKFVNERLKTPKNSPQHKALTKSIKKRVRHLRNEKINNEAKQINGYATRRQIEQLYSAFKSDNSTFRDSSTTKKCEPSKLKDFFKAHFTEKPVEEDPLELVEAPDYIRQLQSLDVQDIKTGPPDEEELRKVIKKMKCGKASCDVPMEYIKQSMSINEFATEMLNIYQTIWLTKKIPKLWGYSKLIALWKGPSKGHHDDPSTYRGLQIGSSLCKIIIVIIIDRLKTWYEKQLLDQQQGFRSARGTTDGIFVAKSVQQITSKMKKPTYVLFIDLTAAFDHVERSWLFKTLQYRYPTGTEETMLKLLESLYSSTTTSLAENPDDKFELTSGVRQGGPESPLLYNLYMDFVMRVVLQKCKQEGVNFLKLKYRIPEIASSTTMTAAGDMLIDWSGYADDLMLFF